MSVLSRRSPVPLYRQLKSVLARRIELGELAPGSVTSEQELGAEFQVSRITIRQALAELEREGRVLRVPGKGTFVAERRKLEPQSALTSFSENMRALGMAPSYASVRVTEAPATEEVSARLMIPSGEPVLRIERVMLADDIPMALMRAQLPRRIYERGRGLFTPARLADHSFYLTLELDLGIELWKAKETVEATTADEEEARLLNLGVDDLLLVVHRHTLDRDGHPVEYTQLRYRADLYRYQVELFRHVDSAGRSSTGNYEEILQ